MAFKYVHTNCNGRNFLCLPIRLLNLNLKMKKAKWKVLATAVVCIMQAMVREATLRWYCQLFCRWGSVHPHSHAHAHAKQKADFMRWTDRESQPNRHTVAFSLNQLHMCVCVCGTRTHFSACQSLTLHSFRVRPFIEPATHRVRSVWFVFDFVNDKWYKLLDFKLLFKLSMLAWMRSNLSLNYWIVLNHVLRINCCFFGKAHIL